MTDQTNPRYLVRKVETCEDCNGKGYYYNPEWTEANKHFDELRKTFRGNSQDPMLWNAWEAYLKEKWPCGEPPEELQCCECEGTGKIERWVDLRQVMRELAQAGGWIEAAPPSGDAP